MVERLGFKSINLTHPYEAIYNREVERVTKRMKVAYSISKLQEEILCDIADIDNCHICLGEP